MVLDVIGPKRTDISYIYIYIYKIPKVNVLIYM